MIKKSFRKKREIKSQQVGLRSSFYLLYWNHDSKNIFLELIYYAFFVDKIYNKFYLI